MAAFPQAAVTKTFLSFPWHAENSALYRNMALEWQGKVGRFVSNRRMKFHFPLFPGALGTARPTFQFLSNAQGKVGRLVLKPLRKSVFV